MYISLFGSVFKIEMTLVVRQIQREAFCFP